MIISNEELNKVIDRSWKIPGLYRRDEARFLYRLARRKGIIVELGCWMGRTTSILLQAAKVWHAEVWTVDAFTEMPNDRKAASPERWSNNLKKIKLKPSKLLAMRTDEAIKEFPQDLEISLLFIDADHGRESVRNDLELWTPKIKIGGVVALHDMFYPSITGVCQAVVDWWSVSRDGHDPIWEFIGLRDFTIAFKRKR